MGPKIQPLVTMEKMHGLIQFEPACLILGLLLGGWLASRILLREITPERKRTLRKIFKNLTIHLVLTCTFFVAYFALLQLENQTPGHERLIAYLGLCVILLGSSLFVKTCRLLLFEYLYLSQGTVPFPLLLVNLFTLMISLILGSWIGTEIFNLQLAPLLATSAVFSLVLGLALQDTLGNLFAGVALQFDKPYEIGDWIEIQSGAQKWTGKVMEITWRATILIAGSEETIIVPNRIMGQSQVANFSAHYRPIIRSVMFRLPHGSDIDKIKGILLSQAAQCKEILQTPPPNVLITEITESWIGFKLIYYIHKYGEQFSIGDRIISRCLKALNSNYIAFSGATVTILRKQESEAPTV